MCACGANFSRYECIVEMDWFMRITVTGPCWSFMDLVTNNHMTTVNEPPTPATAAAVRPRPLLPHAICEDVANILQASWQESIVKFANTSAGRIRLLTDQECKAKSIRVALAPQRCLAHQALGSVHFSCHAGQEQEAAVTTTTTCRDSVLQQCKRAMEKYKQLLKEWLQDPWVVCLVPVPLPRIRWLPPPRASRSSSLPSPTLLRGVIVLRLQTLVLTLRPLASAKRALSVPDDQDSRRLDQDTDPLPSVKRRRVECATEAAP